MRSVPAWLSLPIVLASCGTTSSPSLPPASLQLFAFPSEVEPGGQATISVRVDVALCKTVCLGLPSTTNGGRLFPPPGVDVPSGASIALPVNAPAVFQSITYVAPSHEGSEVVSAACYEKSPLNCAESQAAADVLATTTTRIVIRKPTPESDDSGTSGAPGTGGSAGDATGGSSGESSGGASGAPSTSAGATGGS